MEDDKQDTSDNWYEDRKEQEEKDPTTYTKNDV